MRYMRRTRAVHRRPKSGECMCWEGFLLAFEEEVRQTNVTSQLFRQGERVAIGESDGKDSKRVYILPLWLPSCEEISIAVERSSSPDEVAPSHPSQRL